MNKKSFVTESVEETEAFAAGLAKTLPKGTVIALYGNLGAGKTVFARGFARGLGITEPVSSPTFTIVQEYKFQGGMLYHMDLYRIDNSDAALAFGIDEFLTDENAYSLLEWPERIEDILPEDAVVIRIEHSEDGSKRFITME